MVRWYAFARLTGTAAPAANAQVAVYNHKTTNLAVLYKANDSTMPLGNPFTAGSDGYAFFYAANGRYDVQFSQGGIVTPYSLGDVYLYDPGTIGS